MSRCGRPPLHLDALHGEGLLTETAYRRYGMHDLIRRYAQDRAAAVPRRRPAGAGSAAGLLPARRRPRRGPPDPPTRAGPLPTVAVMLHAVPKLDGDDQALEWVRAERASLFACLDHAAAGAEDARVIALTAGPRRRPAA